MLMIANMNISLRKRVFDLPLQGAVFEECRFLWRRYALP